MQYSMERTLQLAGLDEWQVVWEPDSSRPIRGKCILEHRFIMIYDEKPKDAYDTLLHEILEIKLRPLLSIYRGTINNQIALLEKIAYQQKEATITELTQFFSKIEVESLKNQIHPDSGRESE